MDDEANKNPFDDVKEPASEASDKPADGAGGKKDRDSKKTRSMKSKAGSGKSKPASKKDKRGKKDDSIAPAVPSELPPGTPGTKSSKENALLSLLKRPSLTFGGKFAKILFLIFNTIFMLTGTVFLGMGAYLTANREMKIIQNAIFLGTPAEKYLTVSIYTLLGVGVLIIVVALLGFFGACRENDCMLSCFTFLVIVIFLGEIALGVLALVYKEKTTIILKKHISQVFTKHKYKPGNVVASAWDIVQIQLKCCGIYNHSDYRVINFTDINQDLKRHVPDSCCKQDGDKPKNLKLCQQKAAPVVIKTTSNPGGNKTNGDYLHKLGCFDSMLQSVDRNVKFVMTGIGGVLFVELILVVTALIVCCNKRKDFDAKQSASMAMAAKPGAVQKGDVVILDM